MGSTGAIGSSNPPVACVRVPFIGRRVLSSLIGWSVRDTNEIFEHAVELGVGVGGDGERQS